MRSLLCAIALAAACGHSSSTTPPDVDAAPDLPGPTLTARPGRSVVHLAWTAIDGATSYTVSRDGTAIAPGLTALAFDDTSVANGTPYAYTVAADISAPSNVAHAFAYDPSAWSLRHLATLFTSIAATPDGATLVALGSQGHILRSTDAGATWATAWSPPVAQLTTVKYLANQFVAVGASAVADQTVFTSPDGATWTPHTTSAIQTMNDVAYVTSGPLIAPTSQYIAVGDQQTIVTSPDGVTWTTHTCTGGPDQGDGSFTSLAVIARTTGTGATANRHFFALAVGKNGLACTSTNGSTWTQLTLSPTYDYVDTTAYDALDQITVVGAGTAISVTYNYTTAAIAQSSVKPAAANDVVGATAYDGGGHHHTVAMEYDGTLWEALDGGTGWTKIATAPITGLAAGALAPFHVRTAGGALYILGDADQVLRSTDGGATFAIAHDDIGHRNTAVTYAHGTLVLSGDGDNTFTVATDGTTAAPTFVPSGATLDDPMPSVVPTASGFVAFLPWWHNPGFVVATAGPDAAAWTATALPLNATSFTGDGGLAVDGDHVVATFSQFTGDAFALAGDAAHGFVATDAGDATDITEMWAAASGGFRGLAGGKLYTSPDAKAWTAAVPAIPSVAGRVHTMVDDVAHVRRAFDDKGHMTTTADDGATWTTAPSIPTGALAMVRLGDDLVVAGVDLLAYSDDDGATWTPHALPLVASGLFSLATTDRGVVAVGYPGAVLSLP